MITCVFAGHRKIYEPNIGEKVKKHWKNSWKPKAG